MNKTVQAAMTGVPADVAQAPTSEKIELARRLAPHMKRKALAELLGVHRNTVLAWLKQEPENTMNTPDYRGNP